jgi:putative FmdB family regulatory protein
MSCGHEFSRIESMAEHTAGGAACPKCKSQKLERVFSAFFAKTVRKS